MTEVLARPDSLRADAQRNRSALLDAARAFVERDEQPLLNAVAHEAGVGVGTAYRHFPSQQHLLEALAIDALEDMLDRVRVAVDLPDTAQALRGVVVEAFRSTVRDAALGDLLTAGAFSCADTSALAGDLVVAVGALLDRARDEGLVRADLDADDLRRLICGMRTAAVAGARTVTGPDRYAEILLAGLRPA